MWMSWCWAAGRPGSPRPSRPPAPDTMVVEQFNCLGGVATAGGHGHICLYSAWGSSSRVVGGIPWEMARRVAEAGYGVYNNSSADFEVEGMKLLLEQMAAECGLRILYHTFFCDCVVENGRIAGALIQNKNGRQVVRAKQYIDCTGDGDIAARAGCAFEQGEEGTGICQPMTLMFTIGGVNMDKKTERPRQGFKYQIPYRIIRPHHFRYQQSQVKRSGFLV